MAIENPKQLEDIINGIAGVVTVGLFAIIVVQMWLSQAPEGAKSKNK
ncbi:hypothetical protein OK016_06435 [Vibrio chagasii]|nr:hypothetical protein [Vibrio chagasii]